MADLPDWRRLDCAECKRLIGLYREATGAWARLNNSLLNAAISYEADMFRKSLADCRAMAEKCSQTRHDFRHHIAADHGDSLL
jgi:hypothetical protein